MTGLIRPTKKSQIYDDIKNGPNFMPTRNGSKST